MTRPTWLEFDAPAVAVTQRSCPSAEELEHHADVPLRCGGIRRSEVWVSETFARRRGLRSLGVRDVRHEKRVAARIALGPRTDPPEASRGRSLGVRDVREEKRVAARIALVPRTDPPAETPVEPLSERSPPSDVLRRAIEPPSSRAILTRNPPADGPLPPATRVRRRLSRVSSACDHGRTREPRWERPGGEHHVEHACAELRARPSVCRDECAAQSGEGAPGVEGHGADDRYCPASGVRHLSRLFWQNYINGRYVMFE